MIIISHTVKCPICAQYFDADKESYVKEGRRYLHQRCAEARTAEQIKEEQDKKALFDYINELFKENANYAKINRCLNKYTTQLNYSYSGILKALKYWYEVKGNSIEKANGSIQIVEYIYKDAYDYYYSIWLANQNNETKVVENKEETVNIALPKRRTWKRKCFSFLDKEENINE